MAGTAPLDLPAALTAAKISLRPVEEGDFPFLRRLFRTIQWEELAPTQWPDSAKIEFLDQQFSFQHRHYADAYAGAELYVIRHRAEPVGRFYLDRTTRELRVVEISLLPEWRGRGIGAALLTLLQDEVRAGRGDRVGLSVVTTNPARRLYDRLGFVEAGPPEEFPGLYLELTWAAN